MAGIYIHIPFCKQACHYCDFHFSTQLSGMNDLINAICKELEVRKDYLGQEAIDTVYFGGGTPSLISFSHLEQILEKIEALFPKNWMEVTLEANPDDLKTDSLKEWKSLGIDRLSLGIQSFDEEVLKYYNRAHTAKESLEAIDKARKTGFEKFSIDLIYGHPYSSHSLWHKDLQKALTLDPGHLSCYALTIEPKTALGNWTKKGQFKPADEDFVAEQFQYLQEQTEKAGYIQYEVSNFGKPADFALHNTNYWRQVPYLGVGPSAHSFDGEHRGANPANNNQYIKVLDKNISPFKIEFLEDEDKTNEYILTSLRTIWGIDLSWLKDKRGYDLNYSKREILKKMDIEGWLNWNGNMLSLTKKGKLLADSIASSLFI